MGVYRTEFTVSYKIFACGDRKIQYSRIQHYKIFPTKKVANGDRLCTGPQVTRVKKWANKKAGVKKGDC